MYMYLPKAPEVPKVYTDMYLQQAPNKSILCNIFANFTYNNKTAGPRLWLVTEGSGEVRDQSE